MGLQKSYNIDINDYARDYAAKDTKRHPKAFAGKNQLLWDLGMTTYSMENVELVKKKIDELDKQFDFVLLLEQFHESLTLFQKLMCWPFQDMLYLDQNVRIESLPMRTHYHRSHRTHSLHFPLGEA